MLLLRLPQFILTPSCDLEAVLLCTPPLLLAFVVSNWDGLKEIRLLWSCDGTSSVWLIECLCLLLLLLGWLPLYWLLIWLDSYLAELAVKFKHPDSLLDWLAARSAMSFPKELFSVVWSVNTSYCFCSIMFTLALLISSFCVVVWFWMLHLIWLRLSSLLS